MNDPPTPLEQRLHRLIAADGPISVAQYMHICLSDPEHGYYATRMPLGAVGDFVTAPEVSQMFGEIIGGWLIDTWHKLGSPGSCDLVELGPGRGTLMADILRVASLVPEFRMAARIHLVETSATLRAAQEATLAAFPGQLHWHDAYPEGHRPLLVVANEFFDALPVRQYVHHEGRWHERRVGLAEGVLGFVLAPPLSAAHAAALEAAGDVEIAERSPAAEALVATMAEDIADRRGALLVVDYGGGAPARYGTLQAVSGHHKVEPLATPGRADLTAHVDFARLAGIARAAGGHIHGPLDQGDFLIRLGLLERAGQLGADADEKERAAIEAAVERLAGPAQMGHLFKVMAIASEGVIPEPFGR